MGDEELRREVESLLVHKEQAEGFIETSSLEMAAKEMAEETGRVLVGKQIGAYRITSLLGAGGMGEVYRAEDTRLGRAVAVKVLPEELAQDKERLSRFVREARAASALNHANVAHIYEIGQSDGLHFIAMEYVEGQSLAQKMSGQPLELKEVLDIGIQAADALEEAHRKGITHRDIKPGNLMLTPKGQVKVLDFGLAKITRPEDEVAGSDVSTSIQTAPGRILGTLPYMSPEQVLGKELDARTDLFSLGVVLYEMTTGRLPFSGGQTSEVTDRILHAQPEALARFNYDVPAELERIIRKCLEKDRERRYQLAREVLVDLSRLKEGSAANTVMVDKSVAKPRARLRRLVAVAAVIVMIVAAITYALLFHRAPGVHTREIKSLAVLPLKSLNGKADDYLGLGIADTIISKVSQIEELTVRPTSAVTKYTTQDVDSLQAARQLVVESVLDGTVQRSGERLRITFNLLRCQDGKSLWSESYNLGMTDIFAIQDEVSLKVVKVLQLKLSAAGQARFAKNYTSNPEAYEYYSKAKSVFERRGLSQSAEVESAIALFQKAVELDPSYALARAQLAHAYTWMALFIDPQNPLWFDRARKTLGEAQSLDPHLAETHVVRHEQLWSVNEGFRIEEAIRELRRAQDIDPNVGHSELGILYAHLGLEEQALRHLKRALEIDPLSNVSQSRYVEAYQLLGRTDEAIAAHSRLHNRVGPDLALLSKGRLAEAQPMIEKTLAESPNAPWARGPWALLLALRGRDHEAKAETTRILALEKNRSYHHATNYVANLYALQGNAREAVEWLRKTVEYGMPNYLLFSRDSFLDGIRKDPAFIQFMAELKPRWEGYQREFQ